MWASSSISLGRNVSQYTWKVNTQGSFIAGHTALVTSRGIKRFISIVYLLSSLGLRRGDRIKRGDRIDRGISVEQKIISVAEYRRNVADALAYISAYDKRPARVTAVALGIEEGRLVVWIAANQEVKPKVKDFLTSVLSRLDQIAQDPELECDGLVDFVLQFNWKGVKKYYERFGSEWASYYETLQSSGRPLNHCS
ncbi:unnamed protein product [Aspergillus oryzae]|uniref:Unnamed protein product n=1 Tax=Aspergillus oryzae var. brunneus TaxID=332754 RepID=A0ABQ6L897_ASPOZ|nr:unnamed protein product [Aspergillus oryzae]GMF89739.1 unnamed protein product [Aspergillus oryzae]GMG51383.1 unnamed protein product [Aspergillus oryzae var. brunneus]